MDRARWDHVQAVFHSVSGRPPADQAGALDSACGEDEELRTIVARMLEADARSGSLLDEDAITSIACQLFDQDESAPGAGDEFGPYRIVRPLDHEGGMGLVYLAQRDDLDQLAAIKVLRDAWVSVDRRERFAREQRTLARLTHRSIPRLYDADTRPDGTPWFAMEYVEGLWLTEHCARQGSSLAERLRLFRDVCEAVQHAHQHLVIHRDLKPANILVTADGIVKLLDFGIARQLEAGDPAMAPAKTVVRLMTPTHAAPEQITGGDVSVQADVYSLGVILYELLTGQAPFDLAGLTPRDAETVVLEREPSKPSTVAAPRTAVLRATASDWSDLDVMCLTAMHKDPGRRYQTVEALIRDVDHFRNREPIEARTDSVRYRAGKFILRNARPLAAACVMAAALATVVGFYTVRLTAARNVALAEASRTERIQQFMVSLFDAGEVDVAPAKDLRVLTLLERGVLEADSLEREPDIQAHLYHTLGSLFQKLGDYDRAQGLLTRTLDRRRTLLGPEHADVVDSMIALGLLEEETARLDDAERMLHEALDISRRIVPATHPLVAKASAAYGKLLEERGAYDRAVPLLEEAARVYSTSPSHVQEHARALSELANTHFYAGNLDASEALNRQLLDMNRRLHGPRHPHVAEDLLNLGAIQSNRGNYVEAARYYTEALAINEAWYGNDHPETASAMTILAGAFMFQARYPEATSLLRRALAIQEKAYGPTHQRVAFALNELGAVLLQQKDMDAAAQAFRRTIDIYQQVYGGPHFRVGVALANLGSVYLAAGRLGEAEPLFRQAIDMFTATQSADHMNTAVARIKLGRTLVRQKRFADAETQTVAGYESLSRQTNPSVSWLRAAREDLAVVYEALGQPDQAAKFRAELAQTAQASSGQGR